MIYILLVVVLGIIFWVVGLYNALVRVRNDMKNAWSQIDVQLKRRHDLIPNLIETVKGYAKHERSTLDSVTQARQQAINVSDDLLQRAQAENMLSQTLRSLFAVAENYPDLKASRNFLSLQDQIEGSENRVAIERRNYNEFSRRYNTRLQVFPSNIVGQMTGFESKPYFEAENDALKGLGDLSGFMPLNIPKDSEQQ